MGIITEEQKLRERCYELALRSISVSNDYSLATTGGVVKEIIVEPNYTKKAQEIGLWLIQCAEAAIADESVIRFMQEKVGLDALRAASMLQDLREIRQGTRGAAFPS